MVEQLREAGPQGSAGHGIHIEVNQLGQKLIL